MTWDELLNMEFENGHDGQVLTDIDCPACGRKIYFNSRIVLGEYNRIMVKLNAYWGMKNGRFNQQTGGIRCYD